MFKYSNFIKKTILTSSLLLLCLTGSTTSFGIYPQILAIVRQTRQTLATKLNQHRNLSDQRALLKLYRKKADQSASALLSTPLSRSDSEDICYHSKKLSEYHQAIKHQEFKIKRLKEEFTKSSTTVDAILRDQR